MALNKKTKKELALEAFVGTPEHIRLLTAISADKFPVYRSGTSFYKVAHSLKNSDACKLFEFFNPKPTQVCTYGFLDTSGYPVPTFLAEMGYKVTLEGTMWTAHIPEKLQNT